MKQTRIIQQLIVAVFLFLRSVSGKTRRVAGLNAAAENMTIIEHA